jgi:GT2 family glycosyltransferase/glycosyltransferase involved in cell wall biosynthesis
MSFNLASYIRLDVPATLRQVRLRLNEKAAILATDRAADALRRNDLAAAVRDLQYVQRLAPSSTHVTLAIGELRLLADEPRASEAFELIARRADWRGAWVRLAVARLQAGFPALAAAELHQALSRSAPMPGAEFRRLADEITRVVVASGWCGLNNNGRVTLGLGVGAIAPEQIDIRLDGVPADVRHVTPPAGGLPCVKLSGAWHDASKLSVQAGGRDLIGSPIDVQRVTSVEGFVRADGGGLRGWCWLPGEPETAPALTVIGRAAPHRRLQLRAVDAHTPPESFPDLAAPRRFSVTQDEIALLGGDVEIVGPHGKALYGSPLNPLAEMASAVAAARELARRFPVLGAAPADDSATSEISIPAAAVGPCPVYPRQDAPRDVLVVVPVYRGLDVTMACLDSVLAAQEADEQLLVVVDASPDRQLVAQLERRASTGDFELDVRPVNRGFPATANVGLRVAAVRGHDVILLNNDTLVPTGWVAALRAGLAQAADIGTATPLSNAATVFSYPDPSLYNPMPDMEQTRHLAAVAARANGAATVEVPTGHGFCLLIRHECLIDVGALREDVFAQGYAEENDWCLRARHLGWRHVAVPGAFVSHAEGVSFASAKAHLSARNLQILNRLHPGYDALIQAWQDRAPLAPFRRAMDIVRWQDECGSRPAVLLVSHGRAGGVLRHVRDRAAYHSRQAKRVIVLYPGSAGDDAACRVEADGEGAYVNLVFQVPRELPELLGLLRTCGISSIEIHHFVGHDWAVLAALPSLGPPVDVHVHDYSWYCPRITLTRLHHSYCGEPDLAECAHCVAEHGRNIDEDIAPADLFARSRKYLRAVRQVVVPSEDTARRMERRFGIRTATGHWQDDGSPLVLQTTLPVVGRKRRVCLAGAIGQEKGFGIILDCARMIARDNLPLEFVVVGYTCNDAALLDTGSVTITGRYEEAELGELITAQAADFAFLSALWPETWSYILTAFWDAHLPVVAFDIGAPAERIKRRRGGIVVPLNMPVQRILQTFMTFKASAVGAS